MSIDRDTAVEIAKRHGLGLGDAAGLRSLADTPEQAEAIASRYAAPRQLSRDDLKAMTPEQINKARKDGLLSDLLNGPEPTPGEERLKTMTAAEINAARTGGDSIDGLLKG